MQRTTFRLKPYLLQQLKLRAAERGKSMTQVLEEVLEKEFRPAAPKPFKLITVKGKAREGVDFSDNSALLDLMDGLE